MDDIANQKKKKTVDKPQEEFRDDSLPKGKHEKREKENCDAWTMKQLQKEAQHQGLEEGMTMDKEQLIRKLRG